MLRVLIIGAAGRMGRAVVRAAAERTDLRIGGAVGTAGSAQLGRDAGELAGIGALGVCLTDDLPAALAHCDVAIDFSLPAATSAHLDACGAAAKPLVLCVTGLAATMAREFERAAQRTALLVAPNTSLGVTLLTELVRQSARALPADFDIEIVEAHHRMKRDAPSGTALALGEAAAAGRDRTLEEVAVMGRAGSAPRRAGEIGFAAVRGGDIVGEHTVMFCAGGEQLLLGHRASDRSIFARGALEAALWLAKRDPGRYSMKDVLGL